MIGSYGEGMRYVNVSSGKMHFKDGDEKKTADFIEGKIVKIEKVEDEYEGQKTVKVHVDMEDGDEKYRLQFTFEAWFSVGFFSRLGALDLTRPVRVGVMQSEQNEKVSFCWMKQGNTKIEADKERTPRPKKVTVGKGKSAKEVVDWTDFTEFADGLINLVNGQLQDGAQAPAPAPEKKKEEDDLPF